MRDAPIFEPILPIRLRFFSFPLLSSDISLRTGPGLLPAQIAVDTVRNVHRRYALRIEQARGVATNRRGGADGGANDEAGGGYVESARRWIELPGTVPIGEEAGRQGSQGG